MFTPLYGNTKDFAFGGDSSSPFSGGSSIIKKLEEKYEKLDVIGSIPIKKMEDNINKAYDTWDVILDLWHTFIIADIMVDIFAVLLALFFAILSFLVRKKDTLSKIMLLLALISYPLVKSTISGKINSYARASKIENLQIRKFKYSTNVFIAGDLVNTGKYKFDLCTLDITLYKKTERPPINWVNKIRPLAKQTLEIKNLDVNEYRNFFITIFNIPSNIDFKTNIQKKCK